MTIQESVLHKAQRAVKLTDAELSMVIVRLLRKIEDLENAIKEISTHRSSGNKTAKRNVSSSRVSRQTDA